MEGLTTESSLTLSLGREEITEIKREFHNHKASMSSCGSGSGKSLEQLSRLVSISNTKHEQGESSKTRIQEVGLGHESDKLVIPQTLLIKPIEQRLSILEEEDEVFKESIFRSMEERKILMNEVLEQFQDIYYHLSCSIQEREPNSSSDQAVKEERRHGLMQVLWQDSNPLLISRYAKKLEK